MFFFVRRVALRRRHNGWFCVCQRAMAGKTLLRIAGVGGSAALAIYHLHLLSHFYLSTRASGRGPATPAICSALPRLCMVGVAARMAGPHPLMHFWRYSLLKAKE